MENTLVILISFAVTFLFIIGVPIFLVIGFWVIGVSLVIDFTLANIGVTLYEGLNFYGLLALPLFIYTKKWGHPPDVPIFISPAFQPLPHSFSIHLLPSSTPSF